MAAVYQVGREAHIDHAVLHFVQFLRNVFQVVGRVNLGAKGVFHIQRHDAAAVGDAVEGVLGIALAVVLLAEADNLSQPDSPVFLIYFIERLGSNGIVEELDANLVDAAVVDDRLEVLLGQRRR